MGKMSSGKHQEWESLEIIAKAVMEKKEAIATETSAKADINR
jgi:hypothetical protein